MTLRTIAFAVCLLLTDRAFAQSPDTIRAQLAELDGQRVALRRTAVASEEGLALRQAATDTARAYREAEARIPELAAVDRRLAELRAEVSVLMKQRHAALTKNADALKAARDARDAAQDAYRRALEGGVEGEALLSQRQVLQRQLLDTATVTHATAK